MRTRVQSSSFSLPLSSLHPNSDTYVTATAAAAAAVAATAYMMLHPSANLSTSAPSSSSTGGGGHHIISPTKQHYDHLPPSQLTPSCSRCRAKKLKCQFEDRNPHAACTNCLLKGLGHACHRDLRTPRGKKRLRVSIAGAGNGNGGNRTATSANVHSASAAPSSTSERAAEIAALRTRLRALEGDSGQFNDDGSAAWSSNREDRKQSSLTLLPPPPQQSSRPSLTSRESQGSGHPLSSPRFADSYDNYRQPAYMPSPSAASIDASDAANVLEAIAQRNRRSAAQHGGQDDDVGSAAGSDGNEGRHDRSFAAWARSPSSQHKRPSRHALTHLLRQAKGDLYANDVNIVEELLSVFLFRANHNIGHIIYGPGIHRAMDVFLTSSLEQLLSSGGSTGGYSIADDPACLSMLMLVLCIGFDFHPERPAPGQEPSQGFQAVQALRKRGVDPTQTWYAIARAAFDIEHSYRLSTLAAMQTACLFLARGQETRAWTRMLQRVTIASAQDFNLHRLGRAQRTSDMSNDDFVCLETAVRLWNYLVLRDWCALSSSIVEGAGGGVGHVAGYQIHPNHFTTRKPLNLDDSDLEAGISYTRPLEEWTFTSYFLVQLDMADIVRQAMDLYRAEQRQWSAATSSSVSSASAARGLSLRSVETVQRMAVEFISSLPHYFSLHSQVTSPGLVPIERWTLHQQLFHFMIALCRSQYAVGLCSSASASKLYKANANVNSGGSSNSQSAGSSSITNMEESTGDICHHLAELVIQHHDRVRAICPIIDGLHVHFAQLFNACMTLMLDLIMHHRRSSSSQYRRPTAPPTHKFAPGTTSHLEREQTREKVCRTLDQLHESLQNAASATSAAAPKSSGETHEQEQQRAWQQCGLEMLIILLAHEEQLYHRKLNDHDKGDAANATVGGSRYLDELAVVSRSLIDDIQRHSARKARLSSDSAPAAAAHEPRNVRAPLKQRQIPQETILPVVLAWPSDALYMLTANAAPSQGLLFPVAAGVSKKLRMAGSGQPKSDLTLVASEASFQLSTAAVLEWAMSFDEAIELAQPPRQPQEPVAVTVAPVGLPTPPALPAPPLFPTAPLPRHTPWGARPPVLRSAPHLYHYST